MLGQFNPAVKHPENFLPEESTHYTSPPLHSPCSANCFPSLTLENRLKGKLLLLHFLHEFTVEYFDRSIRLNWIKLTGCVYAYVCKLLGIASE